MEKIDIIVVGAGASGLMAALDLAKAGKKVIILEARDRIGGRIWPLSEKEFGYPAQGGAEFVHGDALVTKALAKEAGLTLAHVEGDIWSDRGGKLTKNSGSFTDDPIFLEHRDVIKKKLGELKEDLPIAGFLERYFSGEEYSVLRNWVTKIAEGYDAADPHKISTFAIRDEWLGSDAWPQMKIKEGYGALLDFLTAQCEENGAKILLGQKVTEITLRNGEVEVKTGSRVYEAGKVVVTLSLGTLDKIKFDPAIPEKIVAASKMGFGNVIKILLSFRSRWWTGSPAGDFSKMSFMLTNDTIQTWWTQYPDQAPVLTGWIPGKAAEDTKDNPDEMIVELALNCLSGTFQVGMDILRKELISGTVFNWPSDPFSLGAYSYATPETEEAREELIKPVDGRIFFAGEALYSGKETATVEGALASGKEVAAKILRSKV